MSFWQILGIEPTKEIAAIKRAYAARSREVHPDDSPEEFRLLHDAYLAAIAYARQAAAEDAGAGSPVSGSPVNEAHASGVPVSEVREAPGAPASEEAGAPKDTSPHYRDIVYASELEKERAVTAAVESALAELEKLLSSRASAADYVSALGAPVTVGTVQTRVCFLAAFPPVLAAFIQSRKELPDRFYDAVTLVYEFSPRLAPSPQKDLQALYSVLRSRKRLLTRKERRREKLVSFFILALFIDILFLFLLKTSLGDVIFLPFILCMVAILVAACINGERSKKPRAPGPYAEELKKYRKRRSLL